MTQNLKTEEGYISLNQAAQNSPYSQEYLSLRARQGKLKCIKLGRNWATKQEWVDAYVASMQDYREELNQKIEEKEFTQAALQQQRTEKEVKAEAIEAKPKLPVTLPTLPRQQEPALRFGLTVALAFLVLISSLAFGKEGISYTFEDAKDTFFDVAQKSKIALNSIAGDIRKGEAEVSLVLNHSLSPIQTLPESDKELSLIYSTTVWQETGHIFESYFFWIRQNLVEVFTPKPKTVAQEEDANRLLIMDSKINIHRELFAQEEYTQEEAKSLEEQVAELKRQGMTTEEIIQRVQQVTQ